MKTFRAVGVLNLVPAWKVVLRITYGPVTALTADHSGRAF
jgi:hypothetical protein